MHETKWTSEPHLSETYCTVLAQGEIFFDEPSVITATDCTVLLQGEILFDDPSLITATDCTLWNVQFKILSKSKNEAQKQKKI